MLFSKKSPSAVDNAATLASNDSAAVQLQEALTGTLQRAIFTSASFAIIATDEKGIIQLFNVGAERMLGYAAAEVVNKISPSDIHDAQEVMARAQALSAELATPIMPGFEALVFKASRGIEDSYELTYIRKDGSRFPAIVSITALRDDYDKIIGYLSIGIDNTARKQAHEEREASEAKLSGLVASMLDAILTIDANHCIVLCNPAAEKMFGLTAAEMRGAKLDRLIPARFRSTHSDQIRQFSQTTASARAMGVSREIFGLHADGSEFPIEASISQIALSGKTMFTVVMRDITERRNTEQELSEKARLLDLTDDAIIIRDMKGRVRYWNHGAEELFGWSRDEALGKDLHSLLQTEFPLPLAQITAELHRHDRWAGELIHTTRAGRHVSVLACKVLDRDNQQNAAMVLETITDITARKQNESNLSNAMAAAEKASLAKSDFLSSMSHELRSPLNAILGFAQLLESDGTPQTDAQKESIGHILQAGWYLLDLINEILDLALVESGKLTLMQEAVSLSSVMLECRAMMEPQAHKKNIGMSFPPFDVPWLLYADRTRVKQVLVNLLSNAIKYNKPNGTVIIDYTAISPERTRISVRDTGSGLSPEKLAQLFQPFNRLGKENSSEEGTGIGLVMTKRLVELMGGTIGVESAVGLGSVFWVELFCTTTTTTTTTEKPKVLYDAAAHTILYVEDNLANLKLIEQLIARRPDTYFLSASNAARGIELAREYLPEAILMDINLPGINGIGALKLLHEDPLTKHIPVIAVSANAMPQDVEHGIAAGFIRYLTKPIKVNEFFEALDAALEYSRSNAPNKIDKIKNSENKRTEIDNGVAS